MGQSAKSSLTLDVIRTSALVRRALVFVMVALVFAIIGGSTAMAQAPALEIDGSGEHWSLLETMEVSQSVPRSAGFDAVRAGNFAAEFESAKGEVPNVRGEDGPLWVSAPLHNTGSSQIDVQMVLKYPQPNRITFFVEGDAGTYSKIETGSAVAADQPPAGRFPHAAVSIPPGEKRQIYLRLETTGPLLVPLQLFTQQHFGAAMTRDYLIFGLLIGCLLAIAIHSGLTFTATKETSFGWFVLFALACAGFILTGTGMAKALLWPGIAFHSNALILMVQGLGNGASAMFLATYLSTSEKTPRLHKAILTVACLAFASSFTTPLPDVVAQPLLFIGLLVAPLMLFGVTVYAAIRGIEGARALLVGWTMIQAGTTWIYLRALDLVPYTEFNHYALPLAATFTALHFSWALTSRARLAEHHAAHDRLTGLPNRFKLEMLEKRSDMLRSNIAGVLQVDLDGFKQVNDTMGHVAGDEVLRTVSKRIASAINGEGQVYRTGGDEFVILAEKRRNGTNLIALANRVIIAASQPIEFRGEIATVGASIGLAVPQSDDEEIGEIVERADAALYGAKRAGKGQVKCADARTERAVLGSALDRAA